MMEKVKRSGRHKPHSNVIIVPEFHKEPDIEKLARAFIATAEKMEWEQRNGQALNQLPNKAARLRNRGQQISIQRQEAA